MRSDRSDWPEERSERERTNATAPVPTAPTAPTAKPSAEIIRLFAAAGRAVLSPAALADEAELTARGEPLP
jgi:hypothetical protein